MYARLSQYPRVSAGCGPVSGTGEDRRVGLDDDKVFKVWEQWAHRRGPFVPRFSTPKPLGRERRLGDVMAKGVEKRHGGKRTPTTKGTGINNKKRSLRKASSDSDVTLKPMPSLGNYFVVRSEPDILASGVGLVFSGNSHYSGHTNGPRQDHREACNTRKGEDNRSGSCPDVWICDGVVDESMCDFLDNVDKENLNMFMEFFEKIIQGARVARHTGRSS